MCRPTVSVAFLGALLSALLPVTARAGDASCATGLSPDGTSVSWQGAAATVTATTAPDGTRSYVLRSTQPLRDKVPASGQVAVAEVSSAAAVRTGNELFDGLFALALEDAAGDSVARITDADFPTVACNCFETGAKWTYVWTRDVSYAAALALSWVDPARMANTLLFKVSDRRDGKHAPEVVQDTGSGGAWPISTDRVVWALGADELQRNLAGDDRQAFLDKAYPALVNTLATDDLTVLAADGLYQGETSFLDWREQSYPAWTKNDTAPIGMGEALSTNALHAEALAVLGRWAEARGDQASADRYAAASQTLAKAIDASFWLPDQHLYGTYRLGAPSLFLVPRADLLGEALAVLTGVAPQERATEALSAYPFTCAGPPVLWPEQPGLAIYHDRAVWPFVTTLWLKAAKAAGHGATELPAVLSLVRGAALNLTNMENFEYVAELPQFDLTLPDGGPVIDSQRQLWSVAGYLSMVVDVLFGKELTDDGVTFKPFITPALRQALFPDTSELQLLRYPYQGHLVDVTIELPSGTAAGAEGDARPYGIQTLTVDGAAHPVDFSVAPASLAAHSAIRIVLGPPTGDAGSVTVFPLTRSTANPEAAATAPAERTITALTAIGASLKLTVATGPTPYTVRRDGVVVATGVTTQAWLDLTPPTDRGVCYTVEATDTRTGFSSQPSAPSCHWPAGTTDMISVKDPRLQLGGAAVVVQSGVPLLADWGHPNDSVVLKSYVPARTATYRVQLTYRNDGPINTGITAGVKELVVRDDTTGEVVVSSALVMPQTGSPPVWRGSTYSLPFALSAGKAYDLVLRDAQNMSYFEHFAHYKQAGGASGPRNRFDLNALKILAVESP